MRVWTPGTDGVYAYWTPYENEHNDRLQAAAQIEIFAALMAWVSGAQPTA